MNLIDLGQVTDTSRWFELSSSSSRGRTYRVEIKETVNCTCEFFNQKNTPCKHILYVYLNVLNVCESSHLLQQVYLTKNELLNIFHQKVPISNENIKLTSRAITSGKICCKVDFEVYFHHFENRILNVSVRSHFFFTKLLVLLVILSTIKLYTCLKNKIYLLSQFIEKCKI